MRFTLRQAAAVADSQDDREAAGGSAAGGSAATGSAAGGGPGKQVPAPSNGRRVPPMLSRARLPRPRPAGDDAGRRPD
jgi:hypothetical protein